MAEQPQKSQSEAGVVVTFASLLKVICRKPPLPSSTLSSILERSGGVAASVDANGCSLAMVAMMKMPRPEEWGSGVLEKLVELSGLEAEDANGNTLMHCIAATNNHGVLSHIASPSSSTPFPLSCLSRANRNGETPLHYSCAYGSEETSSLMIDLLGESVAGGESSGAAVSSGVGGRLTLGASADASETRGSLMLEMRGMTNRCGDGCLMLASRVGKEGTVMKLIEAGFLCGGKDVASAWNGGGRVGERLRKLVEEEGRNLGDSFIDEMLAREEEEKEKRDGRRLRKKNRKNKKKQKNKKDKKDKKDKKKAVVEVEGDGKLEEELIDEASSSSSSSWESAERGSASLGASSDSWSALASSRLGSSAATAADEGEAAAASCSSSSPSSSRWSSSSSSSSSLPQVCSSLSITLSHLFMTTHQLAMCSSSQIDFLTEAIDVARERVRMAKVIQGRLEFEKMGKGG